VNLEQLTCTDDSQHAINLRSTPLTVPVAFYWACSDLWGR